MTEKFDCRQIVTDKIIAAIEAGAGKWEMPWHRVSTGSDAMPVNAARGNYYRGANVVILWMAQGAAGYPTAEWATYDQWKAIGAQVRRGEHSTMITYSKRLDVKGKGGETGGDGDSGEDSEGGRTIWFERAYNVFNAAQVDGYERKADPIAERPEPERFAAAESFIENTGAKIAHAGGRAFYSPGFDRVQLPPHAAFKSSHGYYSTVLHELGHWTGHESRLARKFGARFGDETYAAEELVAELSAAFLCAELGISNEPRPDHTQYLASWLKVLKADKRAIFSAAAMASKAADYLASLQPEQKEKVAA